MTGSRWRRVCCGNLSNLNLILTKLLVSTWIEIVERDNNTTIYDSTHFACLWCLFMILRNSLSVTEQSFLVLVQAGGRILNEVTSTA